MLEPVVLLFPNAPAEDVVSTWSVGADVLNPRAAGRGSRVSDCAHRELRMLLPGEPAFETGVLILRDPPVHIFTSDQGRKQLPQVRAVQR